MLALAAMSASPFVETYDTQMLDFVNDMDVPMAGSEFFPDASMDQDAHGSLYADNESVEVDMETYEGENVEYEMADETAEYNHHGGEPLDVEVYDASHPHSPQPQVDLPVPDTEHPSFSSPVFSDTLTPVVGEVSSNDHEAPSTSEPPPTTTTLSVPSDTSPLVPHQNPVSSSAEAREGVSDSASSLLEGYSTHQTVDPEPGRIQEGPVPDQSNLPSGEENTSINGDASAQPQEPNLTRAESPAPAGAPLISEEQVDARHHPITVNDLQREEYSAEQDTADPHEISDGVYIEPPPAVLVTIRSSGESEFCLFNQPHPESSPRSPSADVDEPESERHVASLLLQHRPTLYYEPLSSVFDALRQEDIINHISDGLEGELVIDAYDLQLVISEDNVYAREISLHDLNILHDGSDLAGPLRIQLRSSVPRFILRYHLLQDQISRLNLVVDITDGENREEERNDGKPELHQPEEEPHEDLPVEGHQDIHETDGTQEPSAEEQPSELHLPLDQPAEEGNLAAPAYEDESHQSVPGAEAQVVEDEGDYEDTNAGGEEAEEILDADQNHDVVDADSSVPATEEQAEFGGEQTEYQDYAETEEYDDPYGEAAPADEGGDTGNEYGRTVGEQELGEQDTSAVVDETRLGSDPQDIALAEPVTNYEPDTDSRQNEAGQGPQEESKQQSLEEDSASTSGNSVLPAEQDQSTDYHSNSQDGADESDPNFLTTLEHEADSALDRPTSNHGVLGDETVDPSQDYNDDWEWDADADAEGEPDDDWVDPDAVSNESSVTLSSKASTSKRAHDEVDFDEEATDGEPPSSPEPKRPRVE
ncbi:hypothetical protein BV22DRAFT_1199263 [Leucogyrophana mollusca]|uniref:Uncharacterized protein n=1 Tax=Leucogyrophana mollusca TaxID=85980 RepID=A0ACB8B475_9AGAM|nr:hypothetical protein BV22DRAFT_1199263 [Leucogyrophana mollusca]